jgi:hypothetical protein
MAAIAIVGFVGSPALAQADPVDPTLPVLPPAITAPEVPAAPAPVQVPAAPAPEAPAPVQVPVAPPVVVVPPAPVEPPPVVQQPAVPAPVQVPAAPVPPVVSAPAPQQPPSPPQETKPLPQAPVDVPKAPEVTPKPSAPAPQPLPQPQVVTPSVPDAPVSSDSPSQAPAEKPAKPPVSPNQGTQQPQAPADQPPASSEPSGLVPVPGGQPQESPPVQSGDTPSESVTPPPAEETPLVAETKATAIAEPTTLATPEIVQSPVAKESLKVDELGAAPVREASQEDIKEMAEAIMAANRGRDNDDHHDGNGNGGHNGNGNHDNDDHQGPGNHYPDGWPCRDRGPSQCNWDGWGHDQQGRPEFYNWFSFDLRIQYCDPVTGQLYTVTVSAGSRRSIDVPRAGNYGFVVVNVQAPGVNVGVGVGYGTFNGGGPCNSNCHVPNRPNLDFKVRVVVQVGGVYQPYFVPAYDCGCGYERDGRRYDGYYFNGNRPVFGYWVEAPQGRPYEERYFYPVTQRDNPVAPLTPVTTQNLKDVLGGAEPPGGNPHEVMQLPQPDAVVSTMPQPDQSKRLVVTGLVFVAALLLGGAVYLVRTGRKQKV